MNIALARGLSLFSHMYVLLRGSVFRPFRNLCWNGVILSETVDFVVKERRLMEHMEVIFTL